MILKLFSTNYEYQHLCVWLAHGCYRLIVYTPRYKRPYSVEMFSCVSLCVMPAMCFLCVRLNIANVLSFWMFVFDLWVFGDWVLAIIVLLTGIRSCLDICDLFALLCLPFSTIPVSVGSFLTDYFIFSQPTLFVQPRNSLLSFYLPCDRRWNH